MKNFRRTDILPPPLLLLLKKTMGSLRLEAVEEQEASEAGSVEGSAEEVPEVSGVAIADSAAVQTVDVEASRFYDK